MRSYSFLQVDAFSREPYLGNPAAVVFDADTLTTEEMQTIARQMNLSETVFLCRPATSDADYHSRIFTPKSELPFAGHPTIAAAHAYLSKEGSARPPNGEVLRQACGIGIVPVAVRDEAGGPLFVMTQGTPSRVDAGVDRTLAARMLGCQPEDLDDAPVEVCSTGLPWLIIPVKTLAALSSADPDLALIDSVCRERDATGVTAYAPEAQLEGCSFHFRTFAPGEGIREDPVCGSCNGAAAVHIAAHRFSDQAQVSYRAEQGLEIHRRGLIHVEVADNDTATPTIRVGGQAVTVMEGTLHI